MGRSRRGRLLNRYREIVEVFTRHGAGALLNRLGILRYLRLPSRRGPGQQESLPVGSEVRNALEELGPTFVKLGQVFSTRSDLLPPEITSELQKLQDAVPPVPYEQVKPAIEEELGDTVEAVFREFQEMPIAAASIAQVHRATLLSGKSVIVKVQRPGIDGTIALDLAILKDLASFVDKHTSLGQMYSFSDMVDEFAATMREELDFRMEAENTERFRTALAKDSGVRVPDVSWLHTTRRVLTMEYVDGVRISDTGGLRNAGVDLHKVARRLAESIAWQILRDGVFHADPHPGNLIVAPGDTVVFLDFGMIGRLSEGKRRQSLKVLLGVAYDKPHMIVEALAGLGSFSGPVNFRKLESDIERLMDAYVRLPMAEMKIGSMVSSIFGVASSHKITVPSDLAMLARSLVTLEGTVAMLDPGMNVLEVAVPIARRLLVETASPSKLAKEAMAGLSDYATLMKAFPSAALSLMRTLESSNYSLKFELGGTETIERRMERAANRMSLSVMLLAVAIVVAGLVIGASIANQTGATSYLLTGVVLRIGLIMGILIVLVLILSVVRSKSL